MVALAIVLSVVVLLLGVLVAGLLRSHADILKALHDLGVGVGEPVGSHSGATGAGVSTAGMTTGLTIGPPLPAERNSTSAPTIAGVTPGGDALAVSVAVGGRLTLVAFLSSGCATCAGFWRDLGQPDRFGLSAHTRLIVVTKGPDMEVPADVAAQAPPNLTVVMSTEAWTDYEVPGSPFFVMVDGTSGRRIGEGVANTVHQVADLVRRSQADARGNPTPTTTGRAHAEGLDGPERERDNDRELTAAGILPGDPSLYPSSLAEVHGRSGPGATTHSSTAGGAVSRAG
jgi:hypothetical protein